MPYRDGGRGTLGKMTRFQKEGGGKKQALPVYSFAEGIGWLAVLWWLPERKHPDQSRKSQRELPRVHLGLQFLLTQISLLHSPTISPSWSTLSF